MQVSSSNVVLQSAHEFSEQIRQGRNMFLQIKDMPGRGLMKIPLPPGAEVTLPQALADGGEIPVNEAAASVQSADFQATYQQMMDRLDAVEQQQSEIDRMLEHSRQRLAALLDEMLERILGCKCRSEHANSAAAAPLDTQASGGDSAGLLSLLMPNDAVVPSRPAQSPGGAMPGQPHMAVGMIHEEYYQRQVSESTSFSAEGVVRTADGKEIEFNLDLSMSRQFSESHYSRTQVGQTMFIDPLVLNYDGDSTDLTDQTFAFDLTADGKDEQIPFVGKGSGILVFDRNKDGVANDGSELFGATTGDGFAELAAYDLDGNGWIDEADPIWSDLMLWSRDAQQADTYRSLAEAGVGAIHTGRTETPFTFEDKDQPARGKIAATGVFLRENGTVGSVQEALFATDRSHSPAAGPIQITEAVV